MGVEPISPKKNRGVTSYTTGLFSKLIKTFHFQTDCIN